MTTDDINSNRIPVNELVSFCLLRLSFCFPTMYRMHWFEWTLSLFLFRMERVGETMPFLLSYSEPIGGFEMEKSLSFVF